MTKVAFFNMDKKEQAVLSKEFAGENSFELRFNQKSLDKTQHALQEKLKE
jgi:hypothetical protein